MTRGLEAITFQYLLEQQIPTNIASKSIRDYIGNQNNLVTEWF